MKDNEHDRAKYVRVPCCKPVWLKSHPISAKNGSSGALNGDSD